MSENFPIGTFEPEAPKASSFGRSLAHISFFFLGFFGSFFTVPGFLPARGQGQLTACKSNCKNLATALEMYSTDNKGLYPATLDPLISGNYLRLLPTCPAACRDTYTDYFVFKKHTSFRFSCVGNNHAKAYTGFPGSCDNLPAYDAEMGLKDHP